MGTAYVGSSYGALPLNMTVALHLVQVDGKLLIRLRGLSFDTDQTRNDPTISHILHSLRHAPIKNNFTETNYVQAWMWLIGCNNHTACLARNWKLLIHDRFQDLDGMRKLGLSKRDQTREWGIFLRSL